METLLQPHASRKLDLRPKRQRSFAQRELTANGSFALVLRNPSEISYRPFKLIKTTGKIILSWMEVK